MKLQLQFALIYLISLILVVLCDELSNTSAPVNWICACSSDEWNQSNISQSNCFNSCRCQADEANGHHWYCFCNEGAFPKITPQSGDGTCFAACNCTSGSLNEVQVSGVKHTSSSKIVVIVLLLCVILTTIALVSSIACYFHRKGNYPINASSSLSSEESLSYNSATNLIIDGSLVTQTKLNISSPIHPSTGCFQNAYFIFKSKPKTIRGTICQFSFSELESATDLFSNSTLIGLGGSSCVYRGRLRDGRTAAIKRLKDHGDPEADHLFSTEVDLLSRLNHCHVVPMLGYCSEFQGRHVERLLVFEYIPNGNLRECLDGSLGETLIWETRVSIAIGAARGLEYLHEAIAPRILHRDVKSTNILLDENWRAKITDLGMAKYLKSDGFASISSSPARMQGTFGYFAPEYAIVGKGSLKSDVFSFGVVLLELITGRQPIQKASREGEESLVIWAATRLQDSRRVISELPDPRLKGKFPAEEMQIMAYLAKECLLLDPDARPTMTEVLQILSSIASDKCRMRNIHAGLYQWSSIHLSRAETNSSGLDDVQVKHPIEEPRMFEEEEEEEEEEVSPVEEDGRLCSEKTILLSSNARSCRSQEEETVDLVEPRLESFCMENVK